MQHLTECVVEVAAIVPEETIAHRRSKGRGVWPACKARPADADGSEWRELSVGRALELGAVLCTHSACAEGVTP